MGQEEAGFTESDCKISSNKAKVISESMFLEITREFVLHLFGNQFGGDLLSLVLVHLLEDIVNGI